MRFGKEERINGQVNKGLIEQSLPGTLGSQLDEPRDGYEVPDGNGGIMRVCRHEMEQGLNITNNPNSEVDLTKDADELANKLLGESGFDKYGNPKK